MKTVTITTAVALTDKQLKTIVDAVTKKYGKGHDVKQVVDPSVIGGVRLTIGSTQLDATVSHKLQQLQNQLLNI
jgi:F-type H+-transporting ATPase subunit delta